MKNIDIDEVIIMMDATISVKQIAKKYNLKHNTSFKLEDFQKALKHFFASNGR